MASPCPIALSTRAPLAASAGEISRDDPPLTARMLCGKLRATPRSCNRRPVGWLGQVLYCNRGHRQIRLSRRSWEAREPADLRVRQHCTALLWQRNTITTVCRRTVSPTHHRPHLHCAITLMPTRSQLHLCPPVVRQSASVSLYACQWTTLFASTRLPSPDPTPPTGTMSAAGSCSQTTAKSNVPTRPAHARKGGCSTRVGRMMPG